jgi:hypothetical protein
MGLGRGLDERGDVIDRAELSVVAQGVIGSKSTVGDVQQLRQHLVAFWQVAGMIALMADNGVAAGGRLTDWSSW